MNNVLQQNNTMFGSPKQPVFTGVLIFVESTIQQYFENDFLIRMHSNDENIFTFKISLLKELYSDDYYNVYNKGSDIFLDIANFLKNKMMGANELVYLNKK